MNEVRVPCPSCQAQVLPGARKCRACKQWIGGPPRSSGGREPGIGRPAVIVAASTVATMAVLLSARPSPVGKAPPLTPLPSDATAVASGGAAGLPGPATIGPDPEPPAPKPQPVVEDRPWRARTFPLGDFHPLAVAFGRGDDYLYVSGDDASLHEVRVSDGEPTRKRKLQARGDRLQVLFDRHVAILCKEGTTALPLIDTQAWDREPSSVELGSSPGDLVELPDGKSVVASTTPGRRVLRFELPGGVVLGDLTLPHASGQLFLVQAEQRPYVAALGGLSYDGRPAGAWVDLFDPTELPFGATRRSIPVGREPKEGVVTRSGRAIFFPDQASSAVTLVDVGATTEVRGAPVSPRPGATFVLGDDRWGVALGHGSTTATLLELPTMKAQQTLTLSGVPRGGSSSADGKALFLPLGGEQWPPEGSGVAVLSGEPPRVVASLPTGRGALAVAVSRTGSRAAVVSYWDRSVTLVEQALP